MPDQAHILIVEDSKDDRDLYTEYLAMQGYRVSTAGDGKEGLEMAFQTHPNVILLDLRLPTLDGWTAMRLLREDERTRDCPVIIVTGLTWLRPKALDCDAWLTKPCSLDQLGEEVSTILAAR